MTLLHEGPISSVEPGEPVVRNGDEIYVASPLLGRSRELELLHRLLTVARRRLVTVTGPVGVGKSSLALAALHALPHHRGTIAVRDLALTAPGRTAGTLRELLPGPWGPDARAVLLDNCDLAVAEVAAAATELLTADPELTVICTSRVPLDIHSEYVLPLVGLSPGPDGDAVRLFRESVSPYYRPVFDDPATLQSVSDICEQLERLPLGIERAAEAFGPLQLEDILRRVRVDRLGDYSRLRTLPERHRSVARALRWGDSALTSEERELARRLSVFESAIDMGLACRVSGVSREQTQRGLAALVHKSLLTSTARDGDGHEFTMPHPVRHHFRRCLGAAPRLQAALRQEHAAAVQALLERACAALRDARWTPQDPVRARALTTLRGRLPDLLTLIRFLQHLGAYGEELRLLLLLEEPALRHGLTSDQTLLAAYAGRLETLAQWAADGGADAASGASAFRVVARWAMTRGDHARAEGALAQSAALSAPEGSGMAEPGLAALRAELARRTGDPHGARQAALAGLRACGGPAEAAPLRRTWALSLAGRAAEAAERMLVEADAELEGASVDPAVRAGVRTALARVRRQLGRPAEAHEAAGAALALLLPWPAPEETADALEAIALVSATAPPGESADVARVLAVARAVRRRHGLAAGADSVQVEQARVRLGEAAEPECEELCAEGIRAALRLLPPPAGGLREPVAGSPGVDGPVIPGEARSLTPRQFQIAQLVSEGMTNRQIARELAISEWTVVNHLRQVMRKLDCPSRMHVARVLRCWSA